MKTLALHVDVWPPHSKAGGDGYKMGGHSTKTINHDWHYLETLRKRLKEERRAKRRATFKANSKAAHRIKTRSAKRKGQKKSQNKAMKRND
jgi:hypothetical protein